MSRKIKLAKLKDHVDKKTISEVMRAMGRKGGKKSMGALTPEERAERGKEGSKNMTPEMLSARAKKAAQARWGKKKSSPRKQKS